MKFSDREIRDIRPGAILAHSVQAGPARFKKGRVLDAADLALLDDNQVSAIMVAEMEDGDVHEDAAAARIAEAIGGDGMDRTPAFTGRVNLIARQAGLLMVDESLLNDLNRIDEAITVATLPNYEPVLPNQMVATIKIIPFSVTSDSLLDWEGRTLGQPKQIEIAPFKPKKAALLQTILPGTQDRLLDKTRDVVERRLELLGSHLLVERRCPHRPEETAGQIRELAALSPDVILVSGASAITDRRDVIPAALSQAGGEVQQFGMPVDPGNLLMLGGIGVIPVIGMPGCARSPKLNGFDWVLQRLCADLPVSAADIRSMGVGGLLKEIPARPLPRAGTQPTSKPTAGRIVPLVLAAGRSTRMEGANKLLSDFRGRPLVTHVMEMLKSCGLGPAIAVSGHQHRDVEDLLRPYDAVLAHNPDYADGMSSSLRRGVAHLPKDCDAVLVCLGDMPLVTAETVKKLVAAFDPVEGRGICLPVHAGKRGHPVLIGRRFFAELLDIAGDRGARDLIRAYPEEIFEVEVDDDGILKDFDDRKAFREHP